MDTEAILVGCSVFITTIFVVTTVLLRYLEIAKNSEIPQSFFQKCLQDIEDLSDLLDSGADEKGIHQMNTLLQTLMGFLEELGHPNAQDLEQVCDILSQPDHPLELLANQWLYIVRVLWKHDEEAIMLPWIACANCGACYELDMVIKDGSHEENRYEHSIYRPPHVRRRVQQNPQALDT